MHGTHAPVVDAIVGDARLAADRRREQRLRANLRRGRLQNLGRGHRDLVGARHVAGDCERAVNSDAGKWAGT